MAQHKSQETRIVLYRQLGGVLCSGRHYTTLPQLTTQHKTPNVSPIQNSAQLKKPKKPNCVLLSIVGSVVL